MRGSSSLEILKKTTSYVVRAGGGLIYYLWEVVGEFITYGRT